MNNLLDSYFEWEKITQLSIIVITFLSAFAALGSPRIITRKTNTFFPAVAIAAYLVFRFGCMPYLFSVDRLIYANDFLGVKYGGHSTNFSEKDPLWGTFSYIVSLFGDVDFFFISQSALYIGLYLFAIQRLNSKAIFWIFIAVVGSMGFSSYGTNTIRAGMAIATIVFGLSYWRKPIAMYCIFLMALGLHFSMAIPLSMILICRYYNNTRLFFYVWFLSVILSLSAGSFFNDFFSTFVEDSRTSYLTEENKFYNQGFRWDFVIYSLVPLLVGAFYIFKKGFKDRFYWMLYNAYILTNSFWVLVIRANFTDRFAYLSWFMIPFILTYPLLRHDAPVKRPNQWLAVILLGEAAFKMIM